MARYLDKSLKKKAGSGKRVRELLIKLNAIVHFGKDGKRLLVIVEYKGSVVEILISRIFINSFLIFLLIIVEFF